MIVTLIGYTSFYTGNIQKLVGGVDYKGRICGYSGAVSSKYNWSITSWDGKGVCLETCPDVDTWDKINWFDPADTKKLICKDAIDLDSSDYYKTMPFWRVFNGDCMFSFASQSYLGFCVLKDMSVLVGVLTTYFSNLKFPAG